MLPLSSSEETKQSKFKCQKEKLIHNQEKEIKKLSK